MDEEMKQLILMRVEVIYGKKLKNELMEELKEEKRGCECRHNVV